MDNEESAKERRMNDPIVAEILGKVNDIQKLLIGNGKIGLCEAQRNTERKIEEHLDQHSQRPGSWKQTLLVIAACTAAGASVLAAVVK